MLLHLDARALKDWLTACPDAEELGNDEYTVDLYDVEAPLSLDLQLGKQGVELLAALTLRYDEERMSVTFAYPDAYLNMFISDKCKNTLQLVLTIQ